MAGFKQGLVLIERRDSERRPQFQLVFVDPFKSNLWVSGHIKIAKEAAPKSTKEDAQKNPNQDYRIQNENIKFAVDVKLSRFDLPASQIASHFANKRLLALDESNLLFVEISDRELRQVAIHVEDLGQKSKDNLNYDVHVSVELDLPLRRLLWDSNQCGEFEFVDLFLFQDAQILVALFRRLDQNELVLLTYALRVRLLRVLRLAFEEEVE